MKLHLQNINVTTKLAYKFHKLCNASNEASLESLLADALATGNRDSYLVFLDLLETRDEYDRLRLEKCKYLSDTLNLLSEFCPNVIDIDAGWIIFKTPTFGKFNAYGFNSQSLEYGNKFLCHHIGSSIRTVIIFYRDYPIIAGHELSHLTINTKNNTLIDCIFRNAARVNIDGLDNEIMAICSPIIIKANQDLSHLTQLLEVPSK